MNAAQGRYSDHAHGGKCAQTERGPVTMAMADQLEAAGSFATAEIARKYAIDRPRWWHRFRRTK